MRPASHDGVLIEKKEKELSKKQRGNANCNAIATLQEHYELVTSSLHRSNSELYNLKSTCCRKECVRNLKYAIHLWNKNKYVENVFVYKKKSSIQLQPSLLNENLNTAEEMPVLWGFVTNEFSCIGITAMTNHRRYRLTNCQTPVELVIFNSERDTCVHWKYKRDQGTCLIVSSLIRRLHTVTADPSQHFTVYFMRHETCFIPGDSRGSCLLTASTCKPPITNPGKLQRTRDRNVYVCVCGCGFQRTALCISRHFQLALILCNYCAKDSKSQSNQPPFH